MNTMNFYYIIFPNGDKQQINHRLQFGDIVDINGNVYNSHQLDPNQITYSVKGFRKKNHFKEIYWFYILKLLTANEVKGEIEYNTNLYSKKKLDKTFDRLLKKVEKKTKKNIKIISTL